MEQSDRNPGRKAGTSNGCGNEEEVEILWTSSEEKWNGESIDRGKCLWQGQRETAETVEG